MVSKFAQNDQIHVEKVQEHHFLRIKKATPNDAAGEGTLGYRKGGNVELKTSKYETTGL